jgi:hypothetical protein
MNGTDDVLDPVLAIFRARLEATIVNRTAIAYLKGSAKMVQFGRTLVSDKPIFFEGPPIRDDWRRLSAMR